MHTLFVLLGTPGSGKTELVRILTGAHPTYQALAIPSLQRIITTTTRLPRTGEEQGREYWFQTLQLFEEEWKSGNLLERAEYRGNHYGLRKSDITHVLEKGDGIIIMEHQGATILREWKPETHFLYMLPLPSAILEARMHERGSTPAEIAQRIQSLPEEQIDIMRCVMQNPLRFAINNTGMLESTATHVREYMMRRRS